MSSPYQILDQLFSQIPHVSFNVIYWNEGRKNYNTGKPEFTIDFKKPQVVNDILRHVSLGFGEGYTRGDIEIIGDFEKLCSLVFDPQVAKIKPSLGIILKIIFQRLKHRNKLAQAPKNISHHYDLSNEFYKLMLDKRMVYSCAYFKTPHTDLDQAQSDKLDYICKKLLLQPGQTLLDIGCGWGALVIHAAQHYGIEATGITLSKKQLEEAQKRVHETGLDEKINLQLIDYRQLAHNNTSFDRIVSVGMLEHVGKENIAAYMKANQKLLKDNGIGLLHTIGNMRSGSINDWTEKYIFPGAYLPEPGELINGFRDTGMEVFLLENLRPHYAMTLQAWLKNLENNIDQLRKIVSEETIRMYRFYLSSCSASFIYGDTNLYQISYSKGYINNAGVPLTNSYLHA